MHSQNDAFAAALAQATADLHEPLSPTTLAAMANHWSMICSWNKTVNLTAITDGATAAWLHYRDALEALQFFADGLTLDVGSGGGFPGVALALARPKQPFLLMEPRRKRAVLLAEAAQRLTLPLVQVYKGRLADEPTARCAQVVTRATFSDLADMAPASRWLAPGGRLMAFRSQTSVLPVEQQKTLEAHGLHYEMGHSYRLLDRERRLDIWILRGDVRHNQNKQARG